ncbi:hypothetical protein [Streptomyces sp. NPDC005805]|uniref:hypothetical protein n=1 Tax=Streptomyces sp. NPDC005805 TaxID=3157068 RepID=UPI0033DE7B05
MSVRMRRAAAAVLTASALCLTAACGGGGDEEKKPAAAEKAAEKAGEKSSAPAEDKPASTEPLTAAQLKAATLVAADLGGDWKTAATPAADESAPKADKPECQPIADLMTDVPAGASGKGGEAEFEKGAKADSALSQRAFTFEGTGAADLTSKLGAALDACPKLTFTDDGEKVEMVVQKLPAAPKTAEESHAFLMEMPIPSLDVSIKVHLLVARQGTGITRAAYIPGEDPAAAKAFDELVPKIGDKLVKAVQG